MPLFEVKFTTTLTARVTVEADDYDQASERAGDQAEEYAQTLAGDGRGLTANATFDGIGGDVTEVSEVAVDA